MAREINLVPDIKDEMIKTLKLRNFIFFLCIVVASASVGITIFFGLIAGGQQLALESKKATLEHLSEKLNSYEDLKDFLTIKDQLGNISSLTNDKQVLSRTFNILNTLLPKGVDTITVSEVNVDLSEEQPTISFDAQANAGKEPFIDYRVLESFKKSMKQMRYDYGKYVDKDGEAIPAYCIIESALDGSIFKDSDRGYYALWTINGEGCKTSSEQNYSTEEYNGAQVVRIWRTPQFNDWYNGGYLSDDGTISGIEHFESACKTYQKTTTSSVKPKWTEINDSCKLVPGEDSEDLETGETGGIRISDSSNGRGSDNELVLRFSASISLSPEVYKFTNTHMLTIPPSGSTNVTDSYIQIQSMFSERAADCAEDDADCKTNGGD